PSITVALPLRERAQQRQRRARPGVEEGEEVLGRHDLRAYGAHRDRGGGAGMPALIDRRQLADEITRATHPEPVLPSIQSAPANPVQTILACPSRSTMTSSLRSPSRKSMRPFANRFAWPSSTSAARSTSSRALKNPAGSHAGTDRPYFQYVK